MYRSALCTRSPWCLTLLLAAALVACSGTTDNEPEPDAAAGDARDVDGSEDDTDDRDSTTSADTSDEDADTAADTSPDMDMTVSCTAPAAECDGDPATVCETDLDSAPTHCGQCGNVCASSEVCDGGTCMTECQSGTTNCEGACVDPSTSASHCGSCGNACSGAANAQAVCIDSACGAECVTGYADCDEDRLGTGCEINTDTDPAHCGACDMACPGADNADPACTAGVCDFACQSGFDDCDGDDTNGCEIDLVTTVEHCGACNNACQGATNADGVCVDSTCDVVCQDGFDACSDGTVSDGCETDLMTDDAHCGACGTVCDAVAQGTTSCQEGACMVDSCSPTYHDLDLDPSNGCEFRLVPDPSRAGLPSGFGNGLAQLEFWGSSNGGRLVALESLFVFGQPPVFDLWTFEPGGSKAFERENVMSAQIAVDESTQILFASSEGYRVASDVSWWYAFTNSLCDGGGCSGTRDAAVVSHPDQSNSFLTTNNEGLKWSFHAFYGSPVPTKMPCIYNGDVSLSCRVDEVTLSEAQRLITFSEGNTHYVLVTHGTPRKFALYSLDMTNGTLDSVALSVNAELGVPDGTPVTDMVYLPASQSVGHGFALSTDEVIQVYRFDSSTVSAWTLEAEFANLSPGTTDNLYALDATRVVMRDAGMAGFFSSPTKPGKGAVRLLSGYLELAYDSGSKTIYAPRSSPSLGVDAFTWSVTP